MTVFNWEQSRASLFLKLNKGSTCTLLLSLGVSHHCTCSGSTQCHCCSKLSVSALLNLTITPFSSTILSFFDLVSASRSTSGQADDGVVVVIRMLFGQTLSFLLFFCSFELLLLLLLLFFKWLLLHNSQNKQTSNLEFNNLYFQKEFFFWLLLLMFFLWFIV